MTKRFSAFLFLAVASAIASASAQTTAQAKSIFLSGSYSEAQSMLEGILANNARDAESIYYLGRVKLVLHDVDAAAELFERASALDATKAEYEMWLGKALGEQARSANVFRQPLLASRSRGHLEHAVALAPNDIEIRKALSEFYAIAPEFLGGGKAKAREQAAEVRRLNAYEGMIQMAWVLADGNDPAGAEKELLVGRRVYPDSAAVVHALSDLYLQRLNRAAEGLQLELAFAAGHESDRVGLFYLGRAASISGDRLAEGEAALRKYMGRTPRYGEPSLAAAHFRLGGILTRRGDKAGARRELETALQLDPSLAAVRSALSALGSG
jgi:tetratricopeptide (TPR) repeat protein